MKHDNSSSSSSEENDKLQDLKIGTNEVKRTNSTNNRGTTLPDMWTQSKEKKDGFFLFGNQDGKSAAKAPTIISNLSNAELSKKLRRLLEVQHTETILNWTCPYISSGGGYDTGLIFSRGKGNKLHVYN